MYSAFTLVRWFLLILCVFFAFFLGRCLARRMVFHDHKAPANRWAFRMIVALVAVVWSGGRLDLAAVLTLAGVVVSSVAGYRLEQRPKPPQEDLSKVMFPKE